MIHRLVRGGEKYLPFAEARALALRATGGNAAQSYEFDDATVRVRIVGEQTYIEITGEDTGGYLCFPSSLEDGSAVAYSSTTRTLAKFKSTADDAGHYFTTADNDFRGGRTDWRGKIGTKRYFITYDTDLTQRYPVHADVYTLDISAQPGIFHGDKEIAITCVRVCGAAICKFPGQKARYVAVTRVSDFSLTVQTRLVNDTDSLGWSTVLTFSMSAIAVNRSPWHFAPDGRHTGTVFGSKIYRLAIAADGDTISATKTEEAIPPGGEPITYFSELDVLGNVIDADTSNRFPIAVDYKADNTELLIYRGDDVRFTNTFSYPFGTQLTEDYHAGTCIMAGTQRIIQLPTISYYALNTHIIIGVTPFPDGTTGTMGRGVIIHADGRDMSGVVLKSEQPFVTTAGTDVPSRGDWKFQIVFGVSDLALEYAFPDLGGTAPSSTFAVVPQYASFSSGNFVSRRAGEFFVSFSARNLLGYLRGLGFQSWLNATSSGGYTSTDMSITVAGKKVSGAWHIDTAPEGKFFDTGVENTFHPIAIF